MAPIIGRRFRAERYRTPPVLRPIIGRHFYRDPDYRRKRDTDTHILGLNIEAELEGRGALARAGRKLGDVFAREGRFSRQGVLPGGKIAEAATKDLFNLPANALASTYGVGAGAFEAAKGRPQRLEEIGRALKEHDPLVLAARGKFGRAAREAKEHPLATALEAAGTGNIVSRGTGAALRHAPSRRVRRIASTERAPRRVPGTRIEQRRRYSPGIVGKGVQVGAERIRSGQAGRLYRRAEAEEGAGNIRRAQDIRSAAEERDPFRVPEKEIRRRIDEREALAESRRRAGRGEVVRKVRRILPERGAEAVPIVAQRITRADPGDLRAFRDRLAREHDEGDLSAAQQLANRRLRSQIDKVLRDRRTDYGEIERAARAYEQVTQPLQRELVERGVLAPESERMAKLVPYAVERMGARYEPRAKRLQVVRAARPEERFDEAATLKALQRRAKRQGGRTLPLRREPLRRGPEERIAQVAPRSALPRELRPEEIEAHMQGRGIERPAFVSQAPGQRGARNFYVSYQRPRGLPSTRRTGEATRKGAFDVEPEVLVETAARARGLRDAAHEFEQFVREFGLRNDDGKILRFSSRRMAEQVARNRAAQPGGHDLRPIRLQPFQGRREQMERLLEHVEGEDVTQVVEGRSHPVVEALDDALEGGGQRGPWALVPEAAADQLQQHLRTLGPAASGKALRTINRAFRGTVLSTSPPWVTGNVLEATLRSALERAGLGSYVTGRRVIEELRRRNPEMADELMHRLGSGHLGMQEQQAIYTSAEQFANTRLAPLARALGTLRRTPGPKQLADAWSQWTHFVFSKNGAIERQFKVAMAGRYARTNLMPDKAIVAGRRAIEQAARGLSDTNEQVALARYVRRAYGKYEAFGPTERRWVALYTPFIAWQLNATKFIFSVLPRDHPVVTGLLAASFQATEDWRERYGLDKFIEGAVPNWIQGSIPTKDSWLRAQRFTPFGLATDPFGSVANAVLPQFSGVLMAGRGLDWKGEPLGEHERASEVPDPERVGEAVKAFISATIPLFGQVTRGLSKEGGPAEKVRGVLNPFEPLKRSDHGLDVAFDRREKVDRRLKQLRRQGISADQPTAEYTRLLARRRELDAEVHRRSHGRYGRRVRRRNVFEGGGGSGGGNVFKGSGGGSSEERNVFK